MNNLEKLEKLQKLKENGTLTTEEFESEKAKILNKSGSNKKIVIIVITILVAIFTVVGVALGIRNITNNTEKENNIEQTNANNVEKEDDVEQIDDNTVEKTSEQSNNDQEEMKSDLNNIKIALKVKSIDLPVRGEYNNSLYDIEYPEILEKPNNYAKYKQLVDNYKGGKLKITGNVNIEKIGEYEVNYIVTSEKGNSKTAKLKVKVEDYMRPEIDVKNDTIEIIRGTKVNILDGVTAVDNIDNEKELTARITTEGKVDVNKVGEYVITYKVKDTAGWTTQRTRTYKVIEKRANIDIKTDVKYIYRVYHQAYTNGYADNTIIFRSNNKIENNAVAGMDLIRYTGTYTIENNIITANMQTSPDSIMGVEHRTLKLDIRDTNTIKDINTGYVYKAE